LDFNFIYIYLANIIVFVIALIFTYFNELIIIILGSFYLLIFELLIYPFN